MSFYSEDEIIGLGEDDAITPSEEGFMIGYLKSEVML